MSISYGSGNPHNFPDIHRTDGILYKYGIKTRFTIEIKKEIISRLIDAVKSYAEREVVPFGASGLEIIKNDTGKPPNWQSMDQIFADDLLVEIADMISQIKEDEVVHTAINHLSEQMKDMIITRGFCPSGRVNRVLQVYMILRDYLDRKHLPKKE